MSPTCSSAVSFASSASRKVHSGPGQWCLPLVCEGGLVVLWVGESAEPDRVAIVAERLGGTIEPAPDGLLAIRKTGLTPPGFPRRTGVAKKRPLA